MLVRKAELNYYPEEIYEIPRQNTRKKKNTKKNKKRSRSNAAIKTIVLFSGLIIMGISLFILLRYANISKIRMEVSQLERQKVVLENTKVDLLGELEGIKSSQNIVNEAINKLGMNYPKEGQIVYVSVKDTNYDLVEETEDKNINKVFSLISSLF